MGGYENIVIIVSIIFLRRYRTPFLAQVYSTEEHESKLTQVYILYSIYPNSKLDSCIEYVAYHQGMCHGRF